MKINNLKINGFGKIENKEINLENKINIIPLNIELTIYGLFLVTFSFSVVLTINVVRVPKIAPIINIVKYNITFIFCSFLGLFK